MPLLDLPMNAEASPPAGRWIETLLLDFPATHEKRDEQANGDRPLPGETRSPVAAPVRF
jgi:hypothetical protein